MQQLNLPPIQLKTKPVGSKFQVFDEVRKKYVALTPEEWVRQHFVHYLVKQLNYSPGLIAVEMPVKVNGLSQRADIVLYNKKGQAVIIVECKAPEVPVTKQVFNQAARYNTRLNVDYLIVTNGMQHYCARLLNEEGHYELLKSIPEATEVYK
ncbi:type I restriction enzyme HsdR N-terminal domain-containing protein [Carboxylicivirga sediminis]|uniref:Type I restriction enzyme HsdR N-terminal domain-containing protein n=1 Tax=Carboxylicivirga sediminis TaxID=2006564 RepID=A0A941IXX4_9BACT|nr:type I restriction enzyme HsdR N-terminal domain-containing protein [Carboxylicivirga sediminis]MBR8535963.1 type I restriction enzyme HsdR N-terminal domain-containing protein [Carboxylicivirga sediminis]